MALSKHPPQTTRAVQPFGNGWTVITNQVSVVTDPANAYEGSNFLALAGGVISNTLPTVAGQTYPLTFAYRGPGIAGLLARARRISMTASTEIMGRT